MKTKCRRPTSHGATGALRDSKPLEIEDLEISGPG